MQQMLDAGYSLKRWTIIMSTPIIKILLKYLQFEHHEMRKFVRWAGMNISTVYSVQFTLTELSFFVKLTANVTDIPSK